MLRRSMSWSALGGAACAIILCASSPAIASAPVLRYTLPTTTETYYYQFSATLSNTLLVGQGVQTSPRSYSAVVTERIVPVSADLAQVTLTFNEGPKGVGDPMHGTRTVNGVAATFELTPLGVRDYQATPATNPAQSDIGEIFEHFVAFAPALPGKALTTWGTQPRIDLGGGPLTLTMENVYLGATGGSPEIIESGAGEDPFLHNNAAISQTFCFLPGFRALESADIVETATADASSLADGSDVEGAQITLTIQRIAHP